MHLSLIFCSSFFGIGFAESIFKAYVINLPIRKNKLESIDRQLKFYNITYEIFPAISPIDLHVERILRMKGSKSDRFDPDTKMDLGLRHNLRPSVIGCLQSHIQVLLKIAKSNSSDPVLILEDDAALEPNFDKNSIDIMNRIKSKWDILHVGYCMEPQDMCDPLGEKSIDYCKKKKQVLWCTHAYFVNGYQGAKAILDGVNTPIPKTYDHILGFATDNYFVSLPKLAKQFPFPSDNGNGIGHWQKILTESEYEDLKKYADNLEVNNFLEYP